MKKRKDYIKFKEILDRYQIKKFYHFTDRSNIESIVSTGGLYSLEACLKTGINIEHPGGSELSHALDRKEKLQDYIHLSICRRHPMMFFAMNEGRITNPVILEVDTDILFLNGNIFSNKNAVRSDAQKGTSFTDFQSIHFHTALRHSQFDVDENEKDYYQAEILVKHHIPLHYICNISDFIEIDTNQESHVKLPYSTQITDDNPCAVLFILNQSFPTKDKVIHLGKEKTQSQVICDIINQQIHTLIVQNTENGIVHNKYQIAVVGYGDNVYNCFNGLLRDKDFVELKELKEKPLSKKKIVKEKKTRQGVVQMELEEPIWINSKSDGNAYLYKALNQAKHLVEKWIELHPNSFPPIIIHISGYGYNGIEDSDIIQLSNEIKALYTKDGHVLLANLIYSTELEEMVVLFPTSIRPINSNYFGEMYYLMSSQLPLCYNQRIREWSNDVEDLSFHTALAFKTRLSVLPHLLHALI